VSRGARRKENVRENATGRREREYYKYRITSILNRREREGV